MSKKVRLFNLIVGIIIIGFMIVHIVSGSNNFPYIIIILYIISFLLQKMNFNENIKFLGLMLTILLFFLSLMTSLPYIFPFAP